MNSSSEAFPTLESGHLYLTLLGEAVAEAQREVAAEVRAGLRRRELRRVQGFQLAAHCLQRLEEHLSASRRALNDLRSLRRLLLQERAPARAAAEAGG